MLVAVGESRVSALLAHKSSFRRSKIHFSNVPLGPANFATSAHLFSCLFACFSTVAMTACGLMWVSAAFKVKEAALLQQLHGVQEQLLTLWPLSSTLSHATHVHVTLPPQLLHPQLPQTRPSSLPSSCCMHVPLPPHHPSAPSTATQSLPASCSSVDAHLSARLRSR